jgi:ribonuclease Z
LIEAASQLDNSLYRYEIHPLRPSERVEVGRDLIIEAFATDHLGPSLGYHLVRRRRHLAAEYRGLEPQALVALKENGKVVEETTEELWLSYCGDTGCHVFELEPRIMESRVLLIECTFVTPSDRAKGESFKHLHLEDLASRGGEFRNENLVLHHLSRRYSRDQLQAEVARELGGIRPRVHLFGV